MPWESENEGGRGERDWSKIMWIGIGALILVMLVLLFFPQDRKVVQTRARAWHILIEYDPRVPGERQAALETIDGLREQIVAGESFSKLAREYSSDEVSAPRGGDLGWVHRDELTENIDIVVWTLPMNEVSEVIETGFGLHLVLITDREIAEAEQYERELHERVLQESSGSEED